METPYLNRVICSLITIYAFGCGPELSPLDASTEFAPVYSIAWTCKLNCDRDMPYQNLDRIEISEELAQFRGSDCGSSSGACDESVEIPFAYVDGSCSIYEVKTEHVAAWLTLCASGMDMMGRLRYQDADGSSVWTMTGVQVPVAAGNLCAEISPLICGRLVGCSAQAPDFDLCVSDFSQACCADDLCALDVAITAESWAQCLQDLEAATCEKLQAADYLPESCHFQITGQ